jgi:hypothetical protein
MIYIKLGTWISEHSPNTIELLSLWMDPDTSVLLTPSESFKPPSRLERRHLFHQKICIGAFRAQEEQNGASLFEHNTSKQCNAKQIT